MSSLYSDRLTCQLRLWDADAGCTTDCLSQRAAEYQNVFVLGDKQLSSPCWRPSVDSAASIAFVSSEKIINWRVLRRPMRPPRDADESSYRSSQGFQMTTLDPPASSEEDPERPPRDLPEITIPSHLTRVTKGRGIRITSVNIENRCSLRTSKTATAPVP